MASRPMAVVRAEILFDRCHEIVARRSAAYGIAAVIGICEAPDASACAVVRFAKGMRCRVDQYNLAGMGPCARRPQAPGRPVFYSLIVGVMRG